MTAARRLAAILAVDVVGYSRLMGEDEPGTVRPTRSTARRTRRSPPWRRPAVSIPISPSSGRIAHSPNVPKAFDGLRKAGRPEG